MQALTLLQKFFSVDMVIYAAIVLVAATALVPFNALRTGRA